jgi:hypothetical protein
LEDEAEGCDDEQVKTRPGKEFELLGFCPTSTFSTLFSLTLKTTADMSSALLIKKKYLKRYELAKIALVVSLSASSSFSIKSLYVSL